MYFSAQKYINQSGAIPLLILVFLATVVIFIAVSAIVSFKKEPLQDLYPKPTSEAASPYATEAKRKSYEVMPFVEPTKYSEVTKDYLLESAKRTGKKMSRTIFYMNIISQTEGQTEGMAAVRDVVTRTTSRGMNVLGVITNVPQWADDNGGNNGPIKDDKYNAYIDTLKSVVQQNPEVHYWEIWNEPEFNYGGNGAQYARMLYNSYDAIKSIRPDDQVVFAGVTSDKAFTEVKPSGKTFMQEVFQNPTYNVTNKFDVANAHVRGTIAKIESSTQIARAYYNSIGRFDAPLWITEHDYPTTNKHQPDANYRCLVNATKAICEKVQAAYYSPVNSTYPNGGNALQKMINKGATKIFIATRDYAQDINDHPECKPEIDSQWFCSSGLSTFPSNTLQGYPTGYYDRPSLTVILNSNPQ